MTCVMRATAMLSLTRDEDDLHVDPVLDDLSASTLTRFPTTSRPVMPRRSARRADPLLDRLAEAFGGGRANFAHPGDGHARRLADVVDLRKTAHPAILRLMAALLLLARRHLRSQGIRVA